MHLVFHQSVKYEVFFINIYVFSLIVLFQFPGPADYRPFEKITEESHRQTLPYVFFIQRFPI